MSFPNYKNKHSLEAMLTPSRFMRYLEEIGKTPDYQPPQGVVFCYQNRLIEHILEHHPTTQVKSFYGEKYLLDETEGQIAICGRFGIGAPVAVVLMEELIAFGVQKFITVGTAGTLQKHIDIGSLVVCEKAIRDEGTSHHYLPTEKYAHASPKITQEIKDSLAKFNHPYFAGTSWTIDAPFRETITEAREYQAEGVSTVEMEAAALFALAQYRNIEIGAMFTISDSLAELTWQPKFHTQATQEGLEILYKVAIDALM